MILSRLTNPRAILNTYPISKLIVQGPASIRKGPSLSPASVYNFASNSKYSSKTTKQIEKQIAMQKWKQLQNTFKSLNSRFGFTKPTLADLENKKYPKPTKIQYNLENLRECSHTYPVYLHWQLAEDNSPFNQVIAKVIDNLWKAEEKETLQFLEFLYAWDYGKTDLLQLHETVIDRFDLDMSQIFTLLKRFDGKLAHAIEVKVIQRLNKQTIASIQYGDLLKIVNFYTVKNLLSEQFYLAVINVMKTNINNIPPGEALEAYVYFTYNIDEHMEIAGKYEEGQAKQQQKQKDKQQREKQDLGISIIKTIQQRILSPECLKFYNGQQLIALLHTFLKNNLILEDASTTEQYQLKLDKIMSRVQLSFYAQDFSTKNKQKLLEICNLLPEAKKMLVITMVQSQLLKKNQKFDFNVLPELYLASYENSLLTEELENKIQQGIAQNIFLLDKKSISRVLWLLTVNGAKNLSTIHNKIQTIIEGGLNSFSIQDVCIIVWSMCATNYNQEAAFWANLQAYLYEQLQRLTRAGEKKDSKEKPEEDSKANKSTNLVNDCSWILWSYHNNRELGMQILSLISQIIITQLQQSIKKPIPRELTTFELINITSFYYSVVYPSQSVLARIRNICLQQFFLIFPTMQSIELCKCLKYFGNQVWRGRATADRILQIFQLEADKIVYRDIMAVVAILISSQIKSKRVTDLIVKLMERKKMLESLQEVDGKAEKEGLREKIGKWKFPI